MRMPVAETVEFSYWNGKRPPLINFIGHTDLLGQISLCDAPECGDTGEEGGSGYLQIFLRLLCLESACFIDQRRNRSSSPLHSAKGWTKQGSGAGV